MFTPDEVERLLAASTVSDQAPWNCSDEPEIDLHLKRICSKIERKADVLSRIEWGHYGSGYASYVDAWFYRSRPEFRLQTCAEENNAFVGLVVLLSRLAPYFVFMQGHKTWGDKGGSSYMPYSEMLDELTNAAVIQLAGDIEPILERNALKRLRKTDLVAELDSKFKVPTILTHRPFRMFDALFYWED